MSTNFDTAKVIKKGIIIGLLTTVGFGFWAVNVDLSAASIASGSLVVESKRKQVQHIEGGWVKQINVKEGQHVNAGDVLLELSNTKAESDVQRLMLRSISLKFHKERLKALLDGQREVAWKNVLDNETVIDTQIVANMIGNEQLQFQQALLKYDLLAGQYTQRKELLSDQLRGNQFQRRAIARQDDLLKQEIDMTKSLLTKGYVSKTRMLELQRAAARIEAQLAELNANIEVTKGELAALDQTFDSQLLDLKQDYSAQLTQTNKEARDIAQSLRAAEDVRSRITIKSEHTGTVVGLTVSSVGGVVNPGDVLMQIVPDSDDLIVEAVISPKDIDVVRVGQHAKVRLSAYNVRRTPPVNGEVIYVAADRLVADSQDGPSGYVVKVRLDKPQLEQLKNIELYPGMQTEVFIVLEERTLWDYLIAPLRLSYYRSMREV